MSILKINLFICQLENEVLLLRHENHFIGFMLYMFGIVKFQERSSQNYEEEIL